MLHTKLYGNRSTGYEDFLSFYHIWAWQPSWSCYQHHVIKFSFLYTVFTLFGAHAPISVPQGHF